MGVFLCVLLLLYTNTICALGNGRETLYITALGVTQYDTCVGATRRSWQPENDSSVMRRLSLLFYLLPCCFCFAPSLPHTSQSKHTSLMKPNVYCAHTPHTHTHEKSFIICFYIVLFFCLCWWTHLDSPISTKLKKKKKESKLWGEMISCSYNAARPFTPTFDNDTLGPHQPYFSAFSLFQFIFAGETRRGARGGKKKQKNGWNQTCWLV